MREIKFRGQTDKKEWVFGSLHVGEYCWITQRSQDENKGLNPFRPIQVDPATVGQYTGLRDKNGVDTYEGDIYYGEYYSEHGDDVELVKFTEVIRPLEYYFTHHYPVLNNVRMAIIIGNIYDTPELLES